MVVPPKPAPLPGLAAPGSAQVYPPAGSASFPAPPVRKSRKWLWIVITLVAIIILASCGLCSWSAYTLVSPIYQQLTGSINVIKDYYTNLQARDYSAAFNDLAPQGKISGLTEQQFSSEATRRDSSYGLVDSFVVGQPSFRTDPNTGPDLSHFTMSVEVKRSHLSYTVVLSVAKMGNDWKITDYSQI
jgi:hypothetical protein